MKLLQKNQNKKFINRNYVYHIIIRHSSGFHFFELNNPIYAEKYGSMVDYLMLDDIHDLTTICSHDSIYKSLSSDSKKHNDFFVKWVNEEETLTKNIKL